MRIPLLATALALIAVPALAQEHSGHDMNMTTDLPPICLVNAAQMNMTSAATEDMTTPMVGHQDLMAGMAQMDADMMAGATAEDMDVAFVCAMIPHHRGAIAMAKAELAGGDDPWARSLAENIIAAQEREIADMLDWLAKQPN